MEQVTNTWAAALPNYYQNTADPILRAAPGVIFDSEFISPDTDLYHIDFFQRPLGFGFKYSGNTNSKDQHFTNLNQACVLDYPQEFSLLSVSARFNLDISRHDHDVLCENGMFEFELASQKILSFPLEYLIIPGRFNQPIGELPKFARPVGVNTGIALTRRLSIPVDFPDEAEEVQPEKQTDGSEQYEAKLIGRSLDSEGLKCTLGKRAIKINSKESFRARITWPSFGLSSIPWRVNSPVMIRIFLNGIRWMPL